MSGVATAVGLGTVAVGAYSANRQASAAKHASDQMASASQFSPYGIQGPFGDVAFNSNGQIQANLSQPQQQLQDFLNQQGMGALSGLGNMGQNGGISQGLQSAYNQYDQSQGAASNLNGLIQSSYGQASQGNPFQGLATQYGGQASKALGQLGSFDPNAAAEQYTNTLRAQAQPENQRAVNSTAQGLFNSGRLGSTGGANVLGRLAESQNNQDLGFQNAGQQYGQQSQMNLGNLAGMLGQSSAGVGQAGSQIQANNYTNFGNLYGMDQSRINSRFQNAMNLFGQGSQNQLTAASIGGGLIGQGQQMNQNLLSQVGLGIDSGKAQSAGGAAGSAMLPGVAAAQGNQTNAWANLASAGLGAYGQYRTNQQYNSLQPQTVTAQYMRPVG